MIRAIIVDDEAWALDEMQDACAESQDIDVLGTFEDSGKALEFAKENQVDLAFLDIEMPGMKGTDLARDLRELNPQMIVVFVSAFDSYLSESCRLKADYYILKPYTHEEIVEVLNRVKLLAGRLKKPVFIQTFGHFDVFYNGKTIPFSSAKAKEVLAVLVDSKGAAVSAEQVFNLLWEDKVYSNYTGSSYRKAYRRMMDILGEYDLQDLVVDLGYAGKAVNLEMFDCDYYKFLEGDPQAIRAFEGEYMVDYPWAEYTAGHLVQLSLKD